MVEVGGSNPPGPTKRQNPRQRRGFFVWESWLDENRDRGSTKSDQRRILVARAKRRRPNGVRAREASALETIWLVLPNTVKPKGSTQAVACFE